MYLVLARDGNAMLYAGPNDSITLDRSRAKRFSYEDACLVRDDLEARDRQPWRITKEDGGERP